MLLELIFLRMLLELMVDLRSRSCTVFVYREGQALRALVGEELVRERICLELTGPWISPSLNRYRELKVNRTVIIIKTLVRRHASQQSDSLISQDSPLNFPVRSNHPHASTNIHEPLNVHFNYVPQQFFIFRRKGRSESSSNRSMSTILFNRVFQRDTWRDTFQYLYRSRLR